MQAKKIQIHEFFLQKINNEEEDAGSQELPGHRTPISGRDRRLPFGGSGISD
jgi:hypothetical protein